jgi:hypothetical protein
MLKPFRRNSLGELLEGNLTSSPYGEGLETDRVSTQVPRQSLTCSNHATRITLTGAALTVPHSLRIFRPFTWVHRIATSVLRSN